MPVSEFDIIQRYFAAQPVRREDVLLGIGDDAAVITPPPGQDLVVALDTLVAGVHFPPEAQASDIGWKALAVNLSDLSAMGAQPAWFTLGLTLPEVDEAWLQAFTQGLHELAASCGAQLVGGDTTRGPLTISIQVAGYVPHRQALLRSGAQAGDRIWVSGELGDAAFGLQLLKQHWQLEPDDADLLLGRLHRPRPRLALGEALLGLATSCIDVSDGLLADLAHLLTAGGVGARLQLASLPVSTTVAGLISQHADLQYLPLYGGDDYELCFTAPPTGSEALQALAYRLDCRLSCIGEITAQTGLVCLDEQGQQIRSSQTGYDHFRQEQT